MYYYIYSVQILIIWRTIPEFPKCTNVDVTENVKLEYSIAMSSYRTTRIHSLHYQGGVANSVIYFLMNACKVTSFLPTYPSQAVRAVALWSLDMMVTCILLFLFVVKIPKH